MYMIASLDRHFSLLYVLLKEHMADNPDYKVKKTCSSNFDVIHQCISELTRSPPCCRLLFSAQLPWLQDWLPICLAS